MTVTIQSLAEHAGYITAILAFLLGGIRYCVWPLIKGIRGARAFCGRLADALPTLLGLSQLFPPGSSASLESILCEGANAASVAKESARAICEVFGIAYYECDSKGMCVFVTSEWSRLFGITLPNAVGLGWKTGIHDDDRDRVSNEWRLAVEEKRDFVLSFRTQTGQDVLSRSHTCRHAGQIVGFVGVVTERKQ